MREFTDVNIIASSRQVAGDNSRSGNGIDMMHTNIIRRNIKVVACLKDIMIIIIITQLKVYLVVECP